MTMLMPTPEEEPRQELVDTSLDNRVKGNTQRLYWVVLLSVTVIASYVVARSGGLISSEHDPIFEQVVHAAEVCSNTSVGATPINDLGSGLYLGEQGGLYPGGVNQIPTDHENLGKAIAATVRPLNSSGTPTTNGKIALLCIGMSNTRNKCVGAGKDGYTNSFKSQADEDPAKNPKVVVVNGAQGGKAIDEWNSETAATWDVANDNLSAAGVTPAQVQSTWIELPDRAQTDIFPADQISTQAKLENVLRIAKTKYPNLKLAYLSSRSYGGYSDVVTSNIDDESAPGRLYAYQTAFGVKWVIQDQMENQGNINPNPDGNPDTNDGVAPWVAWGPYFWADGTTPRSDGLTWNCPSDYRGDGIHPDNDGVKKVGDRLMHHFKTDPTACSWFLAAGCGGNQVPVSNAGPDQTVEDSNGDGVEAITLNGSASSDPDGTIASYEWKEGTTVLGTTAVLTTSLALGAHTITLTVTDTAGASSSDSVLVTVSTVQPAASIAFDAVSSARSGAGTVNTLSWSHPVTSTGANRILLVAVALRNSANQTVSSVTYGGTALTKVSTAVQGTNVRSELWRLLAPPGGTNTVKVTVAGGAQARLVAGATSYTGVHQTSPLGTAATAINSSTKNMSVVVESAPGQVVVSATAKKDSTENITAASGQIERWRKKTGNATASNNVYGGGSEKPGAASVTMSWSTPVARAWAVVAVPLEPAS